MFTQGKILFIIFFLVIFVAGMIWSYQKDKKMNKMHFDGASKTLIIILSVIGILFLFIKIRHYF
jgi:spore maturation protein SpmA